MTEERLQHFSRGDQEEFYREFYYAYLIAEEEGDERLVERYRSFLSDLQKLWNFSSADVARLQTEVISQRARMEAVVSFFVS